MTDKRKMSRSDALNRIKELEAMLAVQVVQDEEYKDEPDDIRSDEYIRIMSMIPWELNLSTGVSGRAPYNFKHMYAIKRVLYNDLVNIIDSNPTFVEKGLFVILDKRVIRKHGLDDFYEQILTRDKLEAVISEPFEVAYPIFKTSNPRQQKIIANILISKMSSGEDVDKNLIYAVSKDTDIDILEKVKDRENLKNTSQN